MILRQFASHRYQAFSTPNASGCRGSGLVQWRIADLPLSVFDVGFGGGGGPLLFPRTRQDYGHDDAEWAMQPN